MSVRDVKNAIRTLTADGLLDKEDIQKAAEAAGNRISAGEMSAIRDAVLDADNIPGTGDNRFDGYDTTIEAFHEAAGLGARFTIHGGQLQRIESLEEATSVRDVSFGGTEVPQAVKDVLAKAYENGLEPFDVTETRRDRAGEVKGVFSDYPSVSEPVENMAFDYTELTPQALEADLNDPSEYNVMVPKRSLGPGGQSMTEITYERRSGGTGNVLSHYDEGMHSDIFARGSSGQKWANNFAILSDGSIHALPAARRDKDGKVILTNPALARGKRVLYMGHLDIQNGVVQSVEMSGRLCRRAASGEQKFIDPIAILDAWGFEMTPSLRDRADQGKGIHFSNTRDGVPHRDLDLGIITKPPSQTP